MRNGILAILTILFSIPMSAQVNIKGRIVDGAGKAIEYVTVIAMEDSTGVVADGNSMFEIKVRNANVRLFRTCHTKALRSGFPNYQIRTTRS